MIHNLQDPKSLIIKKTIQSHQDIQDAFEHLPEDIQVDLLFDRDRFKKFQFQHAYHWKYPERKQSNGWFLKL